MAADGTSPLFARSSDKAVVDGIGRSSKSYGLGRSLNDSFPIKKIAFRRPAVDGDGPHDSDAGPNGDGSSPLTSAQIRAKQQQEIEFEAMKREARAAGLHACKLAQMGIIPGLIVDDGENVKYTPITGSFGHSVGDVNNKKKPKKKVSKKYSEINSIGDTNTSTQRSKNAAKNQFVEEYGLAGEEKEEIKEEEDDGGDEEGSSVPLHPLSVDTRAATATTAPTEFDNTTTASGGTKSSKSSFFDPKRMFRNKGKKAKTVRSTHDEALKEAKDLIASGAWMCGVCGTPFDTSQNASNHEKVCLIEWLKHDKLVRQAWKDEGKPKNTTEVPITYLEHKEPLNYAEYLPPRTKGELSLSSPLVRNYLLMTDEAMVNVARRQRNIMHAVIDRDLCNLSLKKQRAREDPSNADEYTDQDKMMHEDLFVWEREYDAMRELDLASRDRHWHAHLEQRAMERRFGVQPDLSHHDYYYHRLSRIKSSGSDAFSMESSPDDTKEAEEEKKKFSLTAKTWGKLKGRFEHAYKLAKEGPLVKEEGGVGNKRQVENDDKDQDVSNKGDLKHDENTLYINVVVKNSVQVVNNELQRIAKGWWKSELSKSGEEKHDEKEVLDFQFEWIRAHTQKRVIQLAGLALASDFTPRKVAVQLSKDLYRLMGPNLKPRGVTIQTVIEYREGQYFVLAVNVLEIDWVLLMKWVAVQISNPTLSLGQNRSSFMNNTNQAKKKKNTLRNRVKNILAELKQRFPSRNEVVAYFLYFMHSLHELIAVPLLQIMYFLFLRYPVDKLILNAVTDDIFRYVEKKGMEMQLGIKRNKDQASFMLAALREISSDGKKGQLDEEGDEDEDARPIIGPLMGPAIKDDGSDAKPPADFSPPEVLEFIGLETDLPVGFLRLRWAMLHRTSSFFKDAFLQDVLKYDKIEIGQWSANENDVGLPKAQDGVDENAFLGLTLEYSYLMPKSAFVKANMCYATIEIIHYDNYCLVLKEKTLTPEVPYGNTFVSWTQYSIVNTGKSTCRMVCSVEAEFPNGQPMVARQIKSGMRSGTAEKFVSLGETICRYAEAYP